MRIDWGGEAVIEVQLWAVAGIMIEWNGLMRVAKSDDTSCRVYGIKMKLVVATKTVIKMLSERC